MSHKDQSGFIMIVEIIVTVLILTVLGFIGWRLYSQPSKQTDNATSNSQSTTKPSKVGTSASTTTTQPTHLVVKEWGVELPLSDTIKDAYYTMVGSSKGADGLPNTAWLGLTSTNGGGCNISTTGPATTATPIGSIVRVTSTEVDMGTGKLFTQENPNGVTIGSYYYAYQPWNNKKCASASSLQSIDSAFATAAKGIVTATSTLDIKELGIKITLNDQIDDAVYAFVKNQPANGSTLIGISAQSLVDNEANHKSDCVADDAPLGSISKSTTQPSYIGGTYPVDNKTLFKFGGTYYQYVPPQGTYMCGVTPPGYQDSAVASKMSAFKQAFATAQPDK